MKFIKLVFAFAMALSFASSVDRAVAEDKKLTAVAKDPFNKYFTKGTLYTISTKVAGKDYALTVVMNEGKKPYDVNGSTATIQLTKLKEKEESQMWDPHVVDINEKGWGPYYLYSRISQNKKYATHLLALNDFKNEFGDPENEGANAKSNSFGITHNTNDTRLIWMIQKLVNGKYRIASYYGIDGNINKEDEAPSAYKWDQVRCVEAFKMPDGSVKLRHMPISDAPGQQWAIKKTGAFFPN